MTMMMIIMFHQHQHQHHIEVLGVQCKQVVHNCLVSSFDGLEQRSAAVLIDNIEQSGRCCKQELHHATTPDLAA